MFRGDAYEDAERDENSHISCQTEPRILLTSSHLAYPSHKIATNSSVLFRNKQVSLQVMGLWWSVVVPSVCSALRRKAFGGKEQLRSRWPSRARVRGRFRGEDGMKEVRKRPG